MAKTKLKSLVGVVLPRLILYFFYLDIEELFWYYSSARLPWPISIKRSYNFYRHIERFVIT